MKLQGRERTAIAAIVDVAMHQGSAPVSLVAISARQKVSISQLEKLFDKMLRRRLVRSERGRFGGYRLARDAAHITIAEIIRAVDVPVSAICGNSRRGRRGELDSAANDLWSGLNAYLLDYLATVTLGQVIENGRGKPVVETRQQTRRSGMYAHTAELDTHIRRTP